MKNQTDYKLRFIHAADIHLGSIIAISDIQEEDIYIKFNAAMYEAFKKICDEAIKNSVDFIILAGDVFDRELRTVRASSFFYEESKRLKEHNIDIYLVRGNHDPFGEGRDIFSLPSNVYIFDHNNPEVFDIYKNEEIVARIVGQSYKSKWEGRKLFKNYRLEGNETYNIGVLHTGLESEKSNYIPCNVEELKSIENINYWALGHIHKCKVINDKNPFIAYPGVSQGRDIGELGIGGCFLVDIMKNLTEKIRYIPTSSFVWIKEVVNIETDYDIKPMNLNDIEEMLFKRAENILNNKLNIPLDIKSLYEEDIRNNYIVHWEIKGRGEIDKILREEEYNVCSYLKERLNKYFQGNFPCIYTDSIKINTSKEIAIDYLNNNEVIREMNEIMESIFNEEDLKSKFIDNLGSVFEEYRDAEDINEEKLVLDEELIDEILKLSKEIIIEKLLEKGENY